MPCLLPVGCAATLSFLGAGITRATCRVEEELDEAVRAKLDWQREQDRPGIVLKEQSFASRPSNDFLVTK